ncbi:uncharacterized protein METZ01_LOCUS150907, partial [marine metagenome]
GFRRLILYYWCRTTGRWWSHCSM